MTEPNNVPPPPPSEQPTGADTPPPPPPPHTPPPPPQPVEPLPYATPGAGPTGAPPPYAGPAPTPDDRNMATLAHILGIFTSFLGPLIIWLIKKDQSPFVDDQGKEALNFQITLVIGWVISAVATVICIGPFLALGLSVIAIVFGIMGAVASNKGEAYRYPLNIRFIQ